MHYEFKGNVLEIGGLKNLYIGHQSSPNGRSIKVADHGNNSNESMMEKTRGVNCSRCRSNWFNDQKMETQQATRAAEDTPNLSSKVLEGKGNNNRHDNYVLPSLESSLKRSRSCGDGANNNTIKGEQWNCVLRRSNLSALIRCKTWYQCH
jgi:pseudo-response regulator 7